MDRKSISAEIIADSMSPQGHRLTTFLLNVPQIIVKELLRHRMFSFSSSSMRAIPFNKVLADIRQNMFVPIAFQSHHSGMQGTEYLTGEDEDMAIAQWISAGFKACVEAEKLYNMGATKQLCSRIIEPFGYAQILVTATEFDNFFDLRCPVYEVEIGSHKEQFRSRRDLINKYLTYVSEDWQWFDINKSQAEIHIQALAESMWDAMNTSTPKSLEPGDWHIPFGDKINDDDILQKVAKQEEVANLKSAYEIYQHYAIKIATARAARLSYATHDGEIDYQKDIELHDMLLKSKHMSPFEHVVRAMTEDEYCLYTKTYDCDPKINQPFIEEEGWCNNYRGFIQYRYLVENNLTI